MNYLAAKERYDKMKYNRCGKSGLKLPALSLGLWHNFGSVDVYETARNTVLTAFDNGITHFDLANNYGPEAGSAEENFGRMLQNELKPYRDELIISTKAGYYMWPGPYGDFGSRKYMISSLDQSLKRMNLDYVDIFYHHRPDPETPLEETMGALDHIVRQGKAIYAGISNYPADQAQKAIEILQCLGTPCVIHQSKYSMLERWVEGGLLDILEANGTGCIAFSPLAQGMLTNKYLHGIPEKSRAADAHGFLKKEQIKPELLTKISNLNQIAENRRQSLAQMALSWLLKDKRITSVLIGARNSEQLLDSIKCLDNQSFTNEELNLIEKILKG